jgi:hypothetical protein
VSLKALAKRGSPKFTKQPKICTLSLSLAAVLSIENHYFISAVAKEEEENLDRSKTAKPRLSAERLWYNQTN